MRLVLASRSAVILTGGSWLLAYFLGMVISSLCNGLDRGRYGMLERGVTLVLGASGAFGGCLPLAVSLLSAGVRAIGNGGLVKVVTGERLTAGRASVVLGVPAHSLHVPGVSLGMA